METRDIWERISSRKFIVCVAAFLSSLGTSITGLAIENEVIAAFGIVCTVLSAAIYAAVEAATDVASLKSSYCEEIVRVSAEDGQDEAADRVE